MKGDFDFEEEIDIKEKHWKEAITGKISSLKIELMKKKEELKIYKGRLKEIENSFCYNLNLLSDRDLELDALENQLQVKVEQIQRLIFRHNESEKAIIKLDNERKEEMKLFQSQLRAKEQQISQLERKNKANVNTLKQTLEDMKLEYEEKISRLIWSFDNQKKDMENHFQMIVDANAQKHLKETKEITKQIKVHIDLINKEKEKVIYLETQNKYMKEQIAQAGNKFREKEDLLLRKIEEINKLYSQVNRELQSKKKNKQVDHKESLVKPEVKSVRVQTYEIFYNPPDAEKKAAPCKECFTLMADVKESNRNLEKEIMDLKNIMKDDRVQKAEEESIIQNLEMSVYSLKEKLMSELLKKDFEVNENSTEQEILNYTYNKEIQNQIRITLIEHQFNKKLEMMMSSAQEERQLFLSKIEEIKRECVDKIENFVKQTESNSKETSVDNVVSKIRQEVEHLENKIRNNFKDVIGEHEKDKTKRDKSSQISLMDEYPFKMTSAGGNVLITPENKYWIFPNRSNLPIEKHIMVQNEIQKLCPKNGPGRRLNKPSTQVLPRCRYLQ